MATFKVFFGADTQTAATTSAPLFRPAIRFLIVR